MNITEFKAMKANGSTEHIFKDVKFKLKTSIGVESSIEVFDGILSLFYGTTIKKNEDGTEEVLEKKNYINMQSLEAIVDFYVLKGWTDIKIPQKDGAEQFVFTVTHARNVGLLAEIYTIDPKIKEWKEKMMADIVSAYEQFSASEISEAQIAVLSLEIEKKKEELELIKEQRVAIVKINETSFEDVKKVQEQLEELQNMNHFDILKEVTKQEQNREVASKIK